MKKNEKKKNVKIRRLRKKVLDEEIKLKNNYKEVIKKL